MNIKPLPSVLKKTTRTITKEASESIEKAIGSVKSERFVQKNLNRLNPKQSQIDRLNNLKAPNESSFKSIVGDDAATFSEQAAQEAAERETAITQYNARTSNMKNPNDTKFVGLEEQGRRARQREALENVGNLVDDETEVAKIENSINTNAENQNLSHVLSTASEDFSEEATEEITGGVTMANMNIQSATKFGLKPGQSLKSNLKIRQKPTNYDRPVLNTNIKQLPNTGAEANTAFSDTAKAVLGTAVGGAALMAALSGSRGQQNNAQLYGQQPLY